MRRELRQDILITNISPISSFLYQKALTWALKKSLNDHIIPNKIVTWPKPSTYCCRFT